MSRLLMRALRRCASPLTAAPRARPGFRAAGPTNYRRSHTARHLLRPPHSAAAESSATTDATATDAEIADTPHVSVLLDEIMDFFQEIDVKTYVDGTLGAGGHASEVVRRHPTLSTLVGFDLDPTAHSLAGERLTAAGARIVPVSLGPKNAVNLQEPTESTTATPGPTAYLVRGNFSSMGSVLPGLPGDLYGSVDAMLLDLGISSMQVDTSERGFSFLRDGPLDMRMDPGGGSPSAEEAVNTWSEAKLGQVIRDFGEERYWKGIARRIAMAREEAPILTTQQLVRVIGTPGGRGKGGKSKEKKHPATRTFQALRIAVNGELEAVAAALPAAVDALAPGGRLAVITFHSLEDRIVKWAFRLAAGMAPSDEPLPFYCAPLLEGGAGAGDPAKAMVKILTRRPVLPGEREQAENPRSRSAKLRVVERLAD